MNYSVLIIMCL